MEASSQGNEANLFLHYTFDLWMRRNHPDIPFERYADDVICHCRGEEQARNLNASLEQLPVPPMKIALRLASRKVPVASSRTCPSS